MAAKADPVSPHEIEQLRKANVDLKVRESLILRTKKFKRLFEGQINEFCHLYIGSQLPKY